MSRGGLRSFGVARLGRGRVCPLGSMGGLGVILGRWGMVGTWEGGYGGCHMVGFTLGALVLLCGGVACLRGSASPLSGCVFSLFVTHWRWVFFLLSQKLKHETHLKTTLLGTSTFSHMVTPLDSCSIYM